MRFLLSHFLVYLRHTDTRYITGSLAKWVEVCKTRLEWNDINSEIDDIQKHRKNIYVVKV